MSKGQRQQRDRNDRVFPNFPYDRVFTRAEISEILDRSKVIGRAMRYGQGPNGAILAILPDLFELWMIHAALAGVTVDENLAYIRPRVKPDAMVGDAVEWVIKKQDTPEALARDLAEEAAAHAEQIEALDPKLRDAVVGMFVKKSERVAERNSEADVDEGDALAVVEQRGRGAEEYRRNKLRKQQEEEEAR
jgi:hypothetical protein